MKFKLLLLGITLSQFVFAQQPKIEKPDYTSIESTIKVKDSKMYYPVLLDRYIKLDTTLTREELKLLYYGFLFQDSYSVYGHSDYSDTLTKILEKESLSMPDYDRIIKYEKLVLKDYPFRLRDLNILSYAYEKKGMSDSSKIIDNKLTHLVGAILSTGNGEEEKNAWHVISVEDEYDIISLLGYKFGENQSLTGKGCDYMTLEANSDGIKGLYFDVNKILEAEEKLFKEK